MTHKRILATISELAINKPLGSITVTEVTQALAINRGTFYLHFLDMPDAIEALEDELIQALTSVLRSLPTNWLAIFSYEQEMSLYRKITTEIRRHFATYQVLLNQNGDYYFIPKLRQQMKQYVAPTLVAKNEVVTNVPSPFLREIIISGLFDILIFWVRQEPTLQKEQVALILYQSRHQAPAQLVLKSMNAKEN